MMLIRLPLCKYNPEYIEKYAELFVQRGSWKLIKKHLLKHNPEWHQYYKDKGYFDD